MLILLINYLHKFCILRQGHESLSSACIEFSEELHILQTTGVNVCAQHVYRQVEYRSEKEHRDKHYKSDYAASGQRTEYVNDLRYNARGKSKSQKP